MPCSSCTRVRMSSPISSRGAEPTACTADVEERLVEAERLDERGDGREDRHHTRGDAGVVVVVRADRKVACGASRRARLAGMAEWMPRARAS